MKKGNQQILQFISYSSKVNMLPFSILVTICFMVCISREIGNVGVVWGCGRYKWTVRTRCGIFFTNVVCIISINFELPFSKCRNIDIGLWKKVDPESCFAKAKVWTYERLSIFNGKPSLVPDVTWIWGLVPPPASRAHRKAAFWI